MSLKDCLKNAVDGNEISQDDANRLLRDFERLRRGFSGGSDATASAEAKRALEELLKAESAHQKRKAKLAIASAKRIAVDLDTWRNAKGEKDVAGAALDLLENNGTASFVSADRQHQVILATAHAKMEAVLWHFRRDAIAGDIKRHNAARMPNLVRELFGENTGDQTARELASAFSETAEWLRQRFNAAGGAIGKLENWGLPQHHDPRALLKAGRAAWKEAISPMLDLRRMKHPLTGRPIDASELDEILEGIWENVVSDGWHERKPTRQPFGRGALANQHAEHRFLVFKSADDWMRYQADFGGGSDPFAAMMGHINRMSRDTGHMEILGPNPAATIEWLKQIVEKEANLAEIGKGGRIPGKDPRNRASSMQARLEAVWGSMRGTLNTPTHTTIGAWGAGIRSFITSSVLGGASLSAISDTGTSAVTRAFAGVNSSRAFTDIVKAMTPTTRREAVAAGLIFDNAMHVFHQQARYVGTLNGPKWLDYVGDRVLTLSGLTPWTQSARHGFGLAFMREAAEQAGKNFDQLHPLFASKFAQYGIDAAAWDKIRRASKHKQGDGLSLLRPNEIAAVDEKLAERFLGMILSETEYAVPSGTHRSRTALLDQNRPGNLPGEILRSFAQFKSFGAVFAMLHGQRIARMLMAKETRKSGMVYAGALAISSMVFGALSIQLKQVAAGRDPRPMTTPAFWGAAFLQGGGAGIYGDFLFSDINRYGGGLAPSIGGPVAERIGDFTNLTLGNMVELAQGKQTNMGREVVKFLRGNVPGGNVWMTRLVWDRWLMDNLQYLLDPEANKAFKRQQQFWKREFGQEFWFAPGTMTPQRAPNPAAVAGMPAGG